MYMPVYLNKIACISDKIVPVFLINVQNYKNVKYKQIHLGAVLWGRAASVYIPVFPKSLHVFLTNTACVSDKFCQIQTKNM